MPVGGRHRGHVGRRSHSLMKASRRCARIVALLASTSRLCSEWKIVWTAVRPMFSLPRPSPVTKCGRAARCRRCLAVAGGRVGVRSVRVGVAAPARRAVVGSWSQAARHRVVRDVVEEGVAGADALVGEAEPAPCGRIALDQAGRR